MKRGMKWHGEDEMGCRWAFERRRRRREGVILCLVQAVIGGMVVLMGIYAGCGGVLCR